ncbi:hypothetical protein ECANGB1_2235 [Enterospora canceri]|uniref:XPG-I domain-containing protein n=1 Tax=Enterospora canceri TaxID=1081671 RepID=A0A1Y1S8Q8_9MICR|nr:hypothetical protein ECANGB1_2235 [Enterospora canceri]
MPIRALKDFPIICEWPLPALKESSIAIDGFWFIRKYFEAIKRDELIGDLEGYVHKNMRHLLELAQSSSVLWIWDGLNYKKEFTSQTDLCLMDIQTIYSHGQMKFGRSEAFLELLVIPINKLLEKHKIAFMRAPYSAVAQCVYFVKQNCVDYIFTKTDSFLFRDVNSVVVEFNFKTAMCCIFKRSEIEQALGLKRGFFRIFAIASGCDFCPTLPEIANNYSNEVLKEMLDQSDHNDDIRMFISPLKRKIEANEEYKKKINEAYLNCRWHPIMSLNGVVEPLDPMSPPSDIHKIFGRKIPNVFYEELFSCKISPAELKRLIYVTDKQSEETPIDQIVEYILSVFEFKSTYTFNTRDFIEVVKSAFNIRVESVKSVDKILGLVYMHLTKNKNTMFLSNTLTNCIASQRRFSNKNIGGCSKVVDLQEYAVTFTIRSYLSALSLMYVTVNTFGLNKEDLRDPEISEFTLNHCVKIDMPNETRDFLQKNKQ